MADNITPTPPLAHSLPANPPPEDKRQDKQSKHDNDNEEQINDDKPKTRPHHGLFDEYV